MSEEERATGAVADAGSCYEAGLAALRRGAFDEARQWATRCDDLAPGDVRCEVLHGALTAETGEFDRAAAHLRRASSLAPDDTAIARQLGEVLAAGGAVAEAVDVLETAARRDPDDADLLVDLAFARVLSGDGHGARDAIEQAAALRPADLTVRLALARIYEAVGNPLQAAETAAEVARATTAPGVLTDLARLLLEVERFREADAVFRRLQALDPEHDLVARHGRIWCQIKLRDWRSALELALGATRVDRFDLTTALLAYAKDRLFTAPPEDEAAAREAALEERFAAELRDHAELHADDLLDGLAAGDAAVGAGNAGEEGNRG